MAMVTADSLVDMDAVIEIYEIRHIVQPCPFHRFASVPAFQDRFKHRLVGENL